MPDNDRDANPYAAPQSSSTLRSRSAVHASELPWHRRSSSFSIVIWAHLGSLLVIGIVPWSQLIFVTTAVLIVVLCVITLTGPVYFQDHEGVWWQTGWGDRIAAALIGLLYLAIILTIVYQTLAVVENMW